MRSGRYTIGMTIVLLGLAPRAALAQGDAASPQAIAAKQQYEERYQIYVMEGVLERAVQHGVRLLNRQLSQLAPDMTMLIGNTRARGVRLEGYGVFFDVEVPAVRPSVAWSFRVLDQHDVGLRSAVQALRRGFLTVADHQKRQDLEEALTRVERELMGGAAAGGLAASEKSAAAAPGLAGRGVGAAASPHVTPDPNETYTNEVKNALIDAMLTHGGSITIGPDEWLTIAARDAAGPLAGEPYELTTTILQIRGSDLAAYRAGRLTLEEARKKVEVKEW